MNIKSAFQSCLASHPQISHGGSASEDFLGHVFPERDLSASPLINLLSFASTKAFSPWSFDCNPLNCYLLLYTTEGCGKLTINNQVFSLSKGSLLFLNCCQRFRFDIALPPWEYQLAMIEGNPLPYFYGLIPKDAAPIIPVLPYCDIPMTFERLASWSERNHYHELIVSDLLMHLLTCFMDELLEKPNTPP